MAVTNINQILEWFKTGKKPTEPQFRATWGSFWHKHEGVLVKHPTEEDISSSIPYLEAITLQGNVKIQKFGEPIFLAFGNFAIYKASENNNPANSEILELGDVGCGFLTNGTFIPFGKYLGGDIQDVTNSWDTSPMWLPNESGEEPGNDVGGVEPA